MRLSSSFPKARVLTLFRLSLKECCRTTGRFTRYRTESADAPARLGFLIDDVGAAACVQATGQRVDLYGYTSMTVAAVQVQAGEIAQLRAELAALRLEVNRVARGKVRGAGEPGPPIG